MKKILVVLALVLVVASGGLLVWRYAGALAKLPPEAAAAEEAMALPGLLALTTANVSALVSLEVAAHGEPEGEVLPAEGSGDSWFARLERAGIDLSEDVSHLIAGAYLRDGGIGLALGLFGDFSPDAIESALRENPQFRIDEWREDGTLSLVVIDRETCEEEGPYAVHLARGRALFADTETMSALLARFEEKAPAERDIARFQELREGTVAAGAFFVPEDLAGLEGAVDNPIVAMSAARASEQLSGFRAFYLGLGANLLPPGGRLSTVVEAGDPAAAAKLAEEIRGVFDGTRERWEEKLPTLAALTDALDVASEGAELRLAATVDRETAEQLGNLPAEMVQLALGSFDGLGGMMALAPGGEAPAEQLDESPLAFTAEQSVEGLAPYDPEVAFAGSAEQTSGPFGVRLASMLLPEDSAAGPELAVEALATGLPNLGDRGTRAHLVVTSVAGPDGEPILAELACGPQRNDRPEALEAQFGKDVITATKRVRVRTGVRADEVARVAGLVRLQMPVQTEAARILSAKGQSVEVAGARLEITDARASGFGWNLSGNADALLHLRALNENGEPLMRSTASEMDSFFGGGKSGSMDFAGEVTEIEAVFATHEELWEFPFDLEASRPGTSGEAFASKTVEFFQTPLAELEGGLVKATEETFGPPPQASSQAGPFVVNLERVWGFGGLVPHFELLAPQLHNLRESLNGVELVLDEIRLRNGREARRPRVPEEGAQWSTLVSLGATRGEALVGTAHLETAAQGDAAEVMRLAGSLVVRLPRRVASLPMDAALGSRASGPGIELVVSEIARDRFALRAAQGGEKVLAVRAYNGEGRELWIPHASASNGASGWRGDFRVRGIPERLDIMVATQLETARYPFALELDGGV